VKVLLSNNGAQSKNRAVNHLPPPKKIDKIWGWDLGYVSGYFSYKTAGLYGYGVMQGDQMNL
jgi:hypothetical protein